MPTPFFLQLDAEMAAHPVRFAVGIGVSLLATIAVYFVPAWIARGKRNQQNIFWLTLLTGWTGIGWLAALVWALRDEPAERPLNPFLPTVALSLKADELAKLDAQHQAGELTQQEYDKRKRQLLRPG